MIDLKTASTQEIAKYFSHEVNNLLFKPKRIAEEQRDSRQMEDLDICWIKVLSGDAYRTDLRNEASAKAGRQLSEIPFVKRKMGLVDNKKMEDVAKEMGMLHKTIQQSFSKLVFCHFLQSCNKREAQALIKVMGDSFYKLPLI